MTNDTLDDKSRPSALASTGPEASTEPPRVRLRVIVSIDALDRSAQQALTLSRAISSNVVCVHVTNNGEEARVVQRAWEEGADKGGHLIVIETECRSPVTPLLAYLDSLRSLNSVDPILLVLPEFIPTRWWEQLSRAWLVLRLKTALLSRPGVSLAIGPNQLRRFSTVTDKPAQ